MLGMSERYKRMEVIILSLSKNYVELYNNYINEIDEIKKSLKIFKTKKKNALKKGIFAPDEEVKILEKQMMGIKTDGIKKEDTKKVDEEYIESKKEEIIKNENLADVLSILEETEEEKKKDAIDNDMVQVYKFSNGDMYIGRLLDGKMTGIGSYIFAPGEDDEDAKINTEYIGQFSNGVREGKGTFTFSNGNEYIGGFSTNKSNGIGQMKYANGDEYLGNWIDGKKDGLGIYTWDDGYIYIGEFKDSNMDGTGSCFNSKGELVYDGEWKKGLIHGMGRYIWGKNKWYEGEFQQGQKHGLGVFYLNGEPLYNGTWKFDKPSIFDKSFDDIFAEF